LINENDATDLALVYLARGKDAGLEPVLRFAAAYNTFSAGCHHKLYVIMKGWEGAMESEKNKAIKLFKDLGAEIIETKDDGFDWGAYIRFSNINKSSFYCFLNTFSRPTTNNWLLHLFNCIKREDVGICGSSGSIMGWRFKFPLTSIKSTDCLLTPFRIGIRIIWHFRQIKYYPAKLSPHIRSNGFIVKGKQFRKFAAISNFPRTKLDVYRLESGIKSYSNYILELNQNLIIVDSLGEEYEVKDWSNSNTYCCPGQPGLIIADNNTDLYDQKTYIQRQRMEYDTWGRVITQ